MDRDSDISLAIDAIAESHILSEKLKTYKKDFENGKYITLAAAHRLSRKLSVLSEEARLYTECTESLRGCSTQYIERRLWLRHGLKIGSYREVMAMMLRNLKRIEQLIRALGHFGFLGYRYHIE